MEEKQAAGAAPRVRPLKYPIATRALDAWWKFDIRRTPLEGGATRYTFRTLGSTCTNTGTPIIALLQAEVRAGAEGAATIERAWVEFDEEDEGRKRMCAYGERGAAFIEELRRPASFCGRTLEAAIESLSEVNPAGCFCMPAMVAHKWRQMLCAIHYGLFTAQSKKP